MPLYLCFEPEVYLICPSTQQARTSVYFAEIHIQAFNTVVVPVQVNIDH